MRHELPEWERGDTIRSLREIGSLVLDTIAELIPMNFEIKIDEPTSGIWSIHKKNPLGV